MAFSTDKDKGWAKFVASFKVNAGEMTARVGALRSSGVYKPKASTAKKGGGSSQPTITVAQLASIHEFGSKDGRIPERSFMRSAMDQNAREFKRLTKKAIIAVTDGKMTKKQALGLLAQKAVDWIKAKIDEGVPPPNAPSTVARKGSDHPLVDTGQLRNSIDWEIESKK